MKLDIRKLKVLTAIVETYIETGEPVSSKMLTQQLRELEAQHLINREVFPVIPPKVEYSLTETGKSLLPILVAMRDWGAKYMRSQDQTPSCYMMTTDPLSHTN